MNGDLPVPYGKGKLICEPVYSFKVFIKLVTKLQINLTLTETLNQNFA